MKANEIATVLCANGWSLDRHGNVMSKLRTVRVKLNATSCRIERKVVYAELMPGYTPPPQWVNVVSDYYKDIKPNEQGFPVIKGKALKAL